MRGVALTFDGLAIRGASRAGDQSWYRVDPPGLALDVGRGAEPLVGTPWIFLSHGHLDHALGIPWVLSQRRLQGLAAATVFCPRPIVADLERFISVAGRLDDADLDAEVVGLEPGESRELGKDLRLEAFALHHTVPSMGCHLIRTQRGLKDELAGATTEEVAALKRAGAEVVSERESIWLTYCGDTGPKVFSSEPRLFGAKILLIECTFIDHSTRRHGARFGHLHLNDFVEHAAHFANDAIVLTHLSRRYRQHEFEHEVASRLPALEGKFHFIGDGET